MRREGILLGTVSSLGWVLEYDVGRAMSSSPKRFVPLNTAIFGKPIMICSSSSSVEASACSSRRHGKVCRELRTDPKWVNALCFMLRVVSFRNPDISFGSSFSLFP